MRIKTLCGQVGGQWISAFSVTKFWSLGMLQWQVCFALVLNTVAIVKAEDTAATARHQALAHSYGTYGADSAHRTVTSTTSDCSPISANYTRTPITG